jgi:Spy/CpxP family protein refolding chaperone
MSLKNKFMSTLALSGAVLAFSVAASAQEAAPQATDKTEKMYKRGAHGGKHKMGGRRGFGGRGGFALRGIELTEAQKTQLKAIHEANKPSESLRQEMMDLRMAKRNGTLTADQQARLDAIRAERKAKHESIKAQVDAILTAEQKQQIEARKAEMKQRMQEFKEKRKERRANRTAAPVEG